MFIWDFSAIFAVILIFGVGIVLTLWIIYTLNRQRQQSGEVIADFLRHCHYCSYIYLDYRKRVPCRCPRCKSYHD